MAEQTFFMWDVHAPEDESSPLNQPVTVISEAYSHFRPSLGNRCYCQAMNRRISAPYELQTSLYMRGISLEPACKNLRQHDVVLGSDLNIIIGTPNHHDLDAYPLHKRGVICPIVVVSVCSFIGFFYNVPFKGLGGLCQ